MRIPPSPHFTPITLTSAFNADRAQLTGDLQPRADAYPDWSVREAFGDQSYRGIPFALGDISQPNVVVLDVAPVRIPLPSVSATFLVFLHAVADIPRQLASGFGEIGPPPGAGDNLGNALGSHVADYTLVYEDGGEATTPILRRFATQQRHITWGASPFAAVPAKGPIVFNLATEDYLLGRAAAQPAGRAETRHDSGRPIESEMLWLYALPNPHPEQAITGLTLVPRAERSLVYGITATSLEDHPLRTGARQKLRLTLPATVELNALGELDVDSRHSTVGIDLGTVISARAALEYDGAAWEGAPPDVQPVVTGRAVIVEYAAHPAARLALAGPDNQVTTAPLSGGDTGELDITPVAPAHLPVTFRILAAETGQPVPVRFHLHGEAGEYLPPRGHHRLVNRFWYEDNAAEFVNGRNQYSYVDGECVVDLPLGRVFADISRGYEITPLRASFEVTPETREVVLQVERTLDWRARGWVTANTHVHFLSPHVALLEGKAQGVNVLNLLAAQWGQMFSNVGDFDGRTTFGARDFGGDGEFLVRVGAENRQQVLGHISLLGYSGAMIHPLSSGGPAEAAIGDPLEVTMADWAERCRQQGGLVVMPHAPNPQCERAADIVLGLVDGIEVMTFNPYDAQVNPYGLADWYRYLNIGLQPPLVAGSDKMTAASLLGGIRTYAWLGERPFTYESWMDAVRNGHTFVTVGPLLEFSVQGQPAGSMVALTAGGGTVDVSWEAASVNVPIAEIEIVVNGLVAEQITVGGEMRHRGHASLPITGSSWIALRVRGSYYGRPGDIAAHTSAVQVLTGDQPIFVQADAVAILDQI
ncbi:MAG: CehA/McbA family metallohydrolase, partial [Thermomicrobiales bacterium]|nr:CehA/McbA family metallohydrolase [Thermomicrobiales bacterium]